MSTTDEKLDKLIEALVAQSATAGVAVVNEQQKSEIGGWFVLKLVGGLVGAIVTAGLITGMFWLIQTVSETSRKVDTNEQQRVSDRKLDLQKMENISIGLGKVEKNTEDRFTSTNFDNKIAPIIEATNRNTAEIAILSKTLLDRNQFMSDTTTSLKVNRNDIEKMQAEILLLNASAKARANE